MAVPGGGPGIQGSLDDLDSLPTLKVGLPVSDPDHWRDMRSGTGRNNALFRQLGREAHACDDFDALLDRARTLNDDFAEPMNDARVVSTVKSVWRMTVEGRNRMGQFGAWFPIQDVKSLARDPDLLALLAWLQAHNGPNSKFMVADSLRDTLQWSRRQLTNARRRAMKAGWIVQLSAPTRNRAARYRWGKPNPVVGRGITFTEDHPPKLVGPAKIENGANVAANRGRA